MSRLRDSARSQPDVARRRRSFCHPPPPTPAAPAPHKQILKYVRASDVTRPPNANVPSIVGSPAPTSGALPPPGVLRLAPRSTFHPRGNPPRGGPRGIDGIDLRVGMTASKRASEEEEEEEEKEKKRKESVQLKGTRFWIPRPVTLDRTFYTPPPLAVPSRVRAYGDASYIRTRGREGERERARECRKV